MDADWQEDLESYNLHVNFSPIYKLGYSNKISNTIVAFIVRAYDKNSTYIDLRRDRLDDKNKILEGLGANPFNEIFKPIVEGENKEVQDVYLRYLHQQKDVRFRTALMCFEFYTNNINFINEKEDSELADEKAANVKERKAKLLREMIGLQSQGEALINEIKKDYATLDKITESELGFTYTDPENYDINSWSQFIKKKNALKSLSS